MHMYMHMRSDHFKGKVWLHTCMYPHAYTHMHVPTCIYPHACTHMHVPTCMYPHAYTHMHIPTCMHRWPPFQRRRSVRCEWSRSVCSTRTSLAAAPPKDGVPFTTPTRRSHRPRARCTTSAPTCYRHRPTHVYIPTCICLHACRYDICSYVLQPSTYFHRCSFVELLSEDDKPKRPDWFLSHWWGEKLNTTLQCLEQQIRDRDLDRKLAKYWICATALNQWELAEQLQCNPAKSPFMRALRAAGGLLSVVDSSHRSSFGTRLWCNYEVCICM